MQFGLFTSAIPFIQPFRNLLTRGWDWGATPFLFSLGRGKSSLHGPNTMIDWDRRLEPLGGNSFYDLLFISMIYYLFMPQALFYFWLIHWFNGVSIIARVTSSNWLAYLVVAFLAFLNWSLFQSWAPNAYRLFLEYGSLLIIIGSVACNWRLVREVIKIHWSADLFTCPYQAS